MCMCAYRCESHISLHYPQNDKILLQDERKSLLHDGYATNDALFVARVVFGDFYTRVVCECISCAIPPAQ